MKRQKNRQGGKPLYSLISLDDFKALLGVDDRDDNLSRYCLTTATYTIEQYCHRRLTAKRYFEDLAFWGERIISLSHYPVTRFLALYFREKGQREMALIEGDFYNVEPEIGEGVDVPFSLVLSPALCLLRGERSLRAVYQAGYPTTKVPADLVSACLELAAWNMARYKGRKIGVTGNVRGQGERLEIAMPENVRLLLEAYKRRVI